MWRPAFSPHNEQSRFLASLGSSSQSTPHRHTQQRLSDFREDATAEYETAGAGVTVDKIAIVAVDLSAIERWMTVFGAGPPEPMSEFVVQVDAERKLLRILNKPRVP